MGKYILQIFLANATLVIVDATLGYFMAPLLVRKISVEQPGSDVWTTNSIRKLLSAVVALYMFFDCLAYFGDNSMLLLIVTIVVILDIMLQVFVRWKLGRLT
ncbi:hypothetical protein OR1_01092 [Geobacter sp. OR-1]|uniref:hypothetical protein n=1 Tax=Geobacter sp. OR-1 TaxID=1266765 RepID=UPI000541EBC0|nr:hypothetical protein [Geobacter sp. OR-1]GAM08818.1 hypothetical protein OR1_01092 [Geobacter sp. OR-1]